MCVFAPELPSLNRAVASEKGNSINASYGEYKQTSARFHRSPMVGEERMRPGRLLVGVSVLMLLVW